MIERLAQCHYLKEMRPSGDPEGLHFGVQFVVINVRFGSLADIVQRPRHVCFTPNSGRAASPLKSPLCATSAHPQ